MTYQSTFADRSEDSGSITGTVFDIPLIFGSIGLLSLVPFVWWMRRVLRGGPVALFMMLVSCVSLGVALLICGVLAGVLSSGSSGHTVVGGVMAWLGGKLVPAAVAAPIAIAVLIGQRQVREWVDSRT